MSLPLKSGAVRSDEVDAIWVPWFQESFSEVIGADRWKPAVVNDRINSHVLNTSPMQEARDVVAERRGDGRAAVDRALSARGLPGTAVQGKALILGLFSLARLNGKRVKLEERIARSEV